MADRRVGDSVDEFISRAHRVLADSATTRSLVEVCGDLVSVESPQFDWPHSINIEDAFVDARRNLDSAPWRVAFVAPTLRHSMPLGLWPSEWHFPLGVVSFSKTDPYHVALDRHTGTVSVLDPLTRTGAIWVRSFTEFPYWAAATPFRLMLSWIASYSGGELVHGAAIGKANRSVLLVGPSGSGKSTAAFGSTKRGYWIQGDDFINSWGGTTQAVYRRAKLHGDSLNVLSDPSLKPLNASQPDQKQVLQLPSFEPEGLTPRQATLEALVVISRGEVAQVRQVSRGVVLGALAPPSLSGVLGGTPGSLSRIAELVRSVPSVEWSVTWDADRDLDAIDEWWPA